MSGRISGRTRAKVEPVKNKMAPVGHQGESGWMA